MWTLARQCERIPMMASAFSVLIGSISSYNANTTSQPSHIQQVAFQHHENAVELSVAPHH